MARIPRLYRVQQTRADGSRRTRTYQTPEAADERRERWEQDLPERPVTVTPSHPVTYPHPTGDLDTLGIPDTVVHQSVLGAFAAAVGHPR